MLIRAARRWPCCDRLSSSACAAGAQSPICRRRPMSPRRPPTRRRAASGLASRVHHARHRHREAGGHRLSSPCTTPAGSAATARMFDSSHRARQPRRRFRSNRSMAGWRECVQLMTVGEKRRCWVPQDLAYRGPGRPADRHGGVRHRAARDARQSRPSRRRTSRRRPPTRRRRQPGWPTRCSGRAPARASRRPGRRVTVHYTGWTTDGKMFDSSVARGTPDDVRPRRRDCGLDRRRGADGRRRTHPLLDSARTSPTRARPAARAACSCSTSS